MAKLKFLIRYGFPINFDNEVSLSLEQNTSATDFQDHARKYFQEESQFGVILGQFSTPPIKDLHISPYMTREKPDSNTRRVIVDLSFPVGHSVNAGVSQDNT